MHTSFIFACLRKLLRASLVSWRDIMCPCRWSSTAPSPLRSSLAPNCSGLALQFFGVALTVSCLPFGKCVCFSMQLLRLVLGVVGVGGSISPLFAGPSFFKHQGVPGWVGAARRVPKKPPLHARALPGSTNFVGTNAQAHLLVMSLMPY